MRLKLQSLLDLNPEKELLAKEKDNDEPESKQLQLNFSIKQKTLTTKAKSNLLKIMEEG